MRASWKGYFRIGNVAMPVLLYRATRSLMPRFVQLHAVDHSPVQRVTVCMKDGEEVTDGDIVRAVERDGRYIELSEQEIERDTGLERDIVIRQVTQADTIDPVYYDTPYYMAPDEGGETVYAILRRAFEKTGKIAIATFLFYGRQRLAAVSLQGGLLGIHTLRFYDEIMPRSELKLSALPQPSPGQIAVASRLLEHHSLPFHASDYRNQQSDLLNDLIERKAKGLPPRKPTRKRLAKGTTPDEEVVQRMEQMLSDDPRALHE